MEQIDGHALVNHVITNITLYAGMHMHNHCRNRCTMDKRCKSINMGPVIKDTVLCQLSDSDNKTHPNDLKAMAGFMYRGTEVRI